MSTVSYSQSVRFVCDSILGMPQELVNLYGERIRVRISNKGHATQHETLIFDANRHNSFSSTSGGVNTSLYAPYLPLDSAQLDSTTFAVVLDSINTTARLNFITEIDSSDFPDFSLGYGLYYFSVEYPHETCSVPPLYSWFRASWIIDFRDSRFANSYAIGDEGDITFRITVRYPLKECGPPDIDIDLCAPSRSEPLQLANHGQSADYGPDTPIPIHVVFEQTAPEFDFRITGSIYRGLDTTRKQAMSKTLALTHSARIDTNIVLDQNHTFAVTNTFNGLQYIVERDSVTILLATDCHVSSFGPSPASFIIAGRPAHPVRFISSSDTKPTGLVIHGLHTEIDHAAMALVRPIMMHGPDGSFNMRVSNIRRTENQGYNNLIFLDQPYALRLNNVSCAIDSCTIAPIDATVSRGSGILLENVQSHSYIRGSIIEGFPGHGIEIVDGPEPGSTTNPEKALWLDSNIVRNNRMYGVHIRGSRSNPFLSANHIHANGWFGANEPAMQSRKFDGINIQSAKGIFQRNTFDSSGAYGLHAAYNANIFSKWNQHVPFSGENCFRWNYYNLGASGVSILNLMEDTLSVGNSFISPRATWSDPFHVTLRHGCQGHFKWNAWENPDLDADPYPISKVDTATAKSWEDPIFVGDSMRCIQYLSTSGARSDSILNENEINAIKAATANGDWIAARDLCTQLLEASNDAYSATFCVSMLLEALRELDDASIPSTLNLFARDTSKYHTSIAANYWAVKAFAYIAEYDSSLALANFLAQRFLYSEHWRIASAMAAFIQNDYFGNYYAAEDILLAVLDRFPDDAQSIGAYYSVKGTLPDGLGKKGERVTDDIVDAYEESVFDIYPNPAKREITVRFVLGESAFVRVSLYDLTATFVRELCEARVYDAGEHRETRSLDAVPPGYYHSVLRSNGRVLRKLLHIVP
jgi:hypothetical protein